MKTEKEYLWVGNIILTKKREIVLGLNKKGYWQLIGGGQEENERFSIAGQRETKEEAGIDLQLSDLKKLWSGNHDDLLSIRLPHEEINKLKAASKGYKVTECKPSRINYHVFHSIIEKFDDKDIVDDSDIVKAKAWNIMYVLNDLATKENFQYTSAKILKKTRPQLLEIINQKIAV